MWTCPVCQAQLPDQAPRPDRCPACGGQIPPVRNATVKLGDDPKLQPDVVLETLDAVPAEDQDSVMQPPRGPTPGGCEPGSPEASHDPSLADTDRLTLTVKPRELSPEDLQRMTVTWSSVVAGNNDVEQTIKLEVSAAPDQAPSLVVHRRAIRTSQEPVATGADYELLDVIGKGGMGVVYAARQTSVDRTVALKMLRADIAGGGEHREKFMSEAVVTGDLDHPNIVPIYELGSNDAGALFYSMKRVRGTPWKAVIRENLLAENLDILMKVADAVAFAHANGVIHRDLKPENVMLGDFGEVLVMDWGLALATASFRHTEFATRPDSMGGTPAYMAPEMATGPFEQIGKLSDIYLLGAILYEIVSGLRPHTGKDSAECLRAAARNEIQPTERAGELLNIALKALATEPHDRYGSVQEFQTAIREYQSHSESIVLATRAEQDLAQANRSDDYQAFARSLFGFQEAIALWPQNTAARRGLSTATVAYASSALRKGDYDLGISLLDAEDPEHAALLEALVRARRERDVRQRRLTTVRRLAVGLATAVFVVVTVAFFWIRAARDRAVVAEKRAVAAKDKEVQARLDAERAQHEAEVARDNEQKAKNEAVNEKQAAEIARDNERTAKEDALTARDNEAKAKQDALTARDREEAAKINALQAKEAETYQAYLAQIGLAAAKTEENAFQDAYRLLEAYQRSALRHWEWGRLKYLCRRSLETRETPAPVDAVAFAPDGIRFITGSRDGVARIWTAGTEDAPVGISHEGHFVQAVAFSPCGQYVATGASDGRIRICTAADGALIRALEGHTDSVVSTAFSADGKWLLSASYDGTVRGWNVERLETAGESFRLDGHRRTVWSAAYSPDGKRIVTTGQDGKVIVWSAGTDSNQPGFQPQGEFTGHKGPVFTAAFSPNGRRVVTGGYDGRVLIWDPAQARPVDIQNRLTSVGADTDAQVPSALALDGHTAPVHAVGFSADGQLVFSGSDDNTVRIWDANSGKHIKTLRGHSGWVRACALSPAMPSRHDRRVLSGSHDKTARLWSVAGYQEVRVLQSRVLKGHADAVLAAAFDPSGTRVVTASRDHTAGIWDVASGERLLELKEGHEFLASTAVFDARGKRLLTAAVDGSVRIWNVASGMQLRQLEGTGRNAAMALSQDGRWVLTGGDKHAVEDLWPAHLWDAATGKHLRTLTGHSAPVSAVAISRDGRWLLTADEHGQGRLWDARTGAAGPLLEGHSQGITAAAFLPDGRRLLTASYDKTVGQWDVESGKERRELVLKHPDSVMAMAISPDGRRVLTSCADRTVRLWDTDSAQLARRLDAEGGAIALAANANRLLYQQRWKPADLAARCSLSEARLAEILSATGPMAPDTLELLADAFGTEARVLLRPLISSVAFSPNGTTALAANFEDRTVVAWRLATEPVPDRPKSVVAARTVLDLRAQGGSVWSAIFSPDGKQVLSVGGNDARLWDTATWQECMSFSPHGVVASAGFSPDGKQVVTGSWDRCVKLWDASTGQGVGKLWGKSIGAINHAVFSPVENTRVLAASDDGTARLWDVRGKTELTVFRGHKGAVHSAVFSADGHYVVTASSDKTARIWNAKTGAPLVVLRGHRAPVLCAVFSPHGQRLLTGSEDKTAKVWSLESDVPEPDRLLHTLQGHTARVSAVAFSPDGRRLLTGGDDNTAKLWDARAGREVFSLEGHSRGVTAVQFAPDGRFVLTASRDGTATIWLADDWREPVTGG